MSPVPNEDSYVIISAVKDEEKYVETTIRAVLRQTVRPSVWVIVDDGSRDRTPEIVERYARSFHCIRLLRLERDGQRQPGSAVIRAFAAGYEAIRRENFNFLVKLDCDLDLAPDYFEQLLKRFHEDPRLGIASGIYLENKRGRWLPIEMPAYHAAGASKMVRAKCFRDIGGFVASRGWDTLDEIRALMRGWKTRHFQELKLFHLRNEGLGIGSLRTNRMNGEVYYLTGGGKLFFALKMLHRMIFGQPFLLGGLALLWGFVVPWVCRKPLLASDAEARFYRQLLNRRIWHRLSEIRNGENWKPEASSAN